MSKCLGDLRHERDAAASCKLVLRFMLVSRFPRFVASRAKSPPDCSATGFQGPSDFVMMRLVTHVTCISHFPIGTRAQHRTKLHQGLR